MVNRPVFRQLNVVIEDSSFDTDSSGKSRPKPVYCRRSANTGGVRVSKQNTERTLTVRQASPARGTASPRARPCYQTPALTTCFRFLEAWHPALSTVGIVEILCRRRPAAHPIDRRAFAALDEYGDVPMAFSLNGPGHEFEVRTRRRRCRFDVHNRRHRTFPQIVVMPEIGLVCGILDVGA